jgi:hypothetical protein
MYSSAVHAAQAGVGEVESFLAAQGLNARVIVEGAQKASGTANEALEQARPTLDSTVSRLSAADPTLIAKYVAGALAVYYLVRARALPCTSCVFVEGGRTHPLLGKGEGKDICLEGNTSCSLP